jgi:acetyl esterase/lipase
VPVTDFSLRAGDFGGDEENLSITAYDAGGHIIGASSLLWSTDQTPPFAVLNVAAPAISSIVYRSDGDFPSSTFIDDLTFTPIPEPSTAIFFVLLGAAAFCPRAGERQLLNRLLVKCAVSAWLGFLAFSQENDG